MIRACIYLSAHSMDISYIPPFGRLPTMCTAPVTRMISLSGRRGQVEGGREASSWSTSRDVIETMYRKGETKPVKERLKKFQ